MILIHYEFSLLISNSLGLFSRKLNTSLYLINELGLYNLKYKYSSDYDYFYRMIVKKKLTGVGTKKNEIFGTFRRGGFSSKISFSDHFFEEIKIRLDNKQNRILILIIFIYKFIKNFNKL